MSYKYWGGDPKRRLSEYRSDTKNTAKIARFWAVRSVRADVRDVVNFKLKKTMLKEQGVHPLKPCGYITCHQVAHSNHLRSAHTVYLCFSYGSEKKQRLLHCAALTDWRFCNRNGECLLRGTDWICTYNSDLILVVTGLRTYATWFIGIVNDEKWRTGVKTWVN